MRAKAQNAYFDFHSAAQRSSRNRRLACIVYIVDVCVETAKGYREDVCVM